MIIGPALSLLGSTIGGTLSAVGSIGGGLIKGASKLLGGGGGQGAPGSGRELATISQSSLGADTSIGTSLALPSPTLMGNALAPSKDTPLSPAMKMMNIFINMQRSLKAIENSIRKLLGIERARMQSESKEQRFAGGETDAPPGDEGGGKGPGFFSKMMSGIGDTIGSMPSWLKTLGLGALLFWMSKNRDKIATTLVPFLEWIKDTSEYLLNTPWERKDGSGIKQDLIDKATELLNVFLGPLGLKYDDDGTMSLVEGSWLDLIMFWTGPTNIFKTLKSLWEGKNPDTGEYFIPVWMRPPSEWEWYNKWKASKAEAGFEEDDLFYNIWSLWNGKNPVTGESFLPEWMNTPIGEMEWYKTLQTDFLSNLKSDPAATLKAIWEGKNPATGESFLPEWMTKPLTEQQWYIDTTKWYDEFAGSDFGKTINLPTSEEIETAFGDAFNWIYNEETGEFFGMDLTKLKTDLQAQWQGVIDFIYNRETGAVLGINFRELKNMLPSLREIADNIISSLPKWMRPDTIAEQISDVEAELRKVKATKVVGEKGGPWVDLPARLDTADERAKAIAELEAKLATLLALSTTLTTPTGLLPPTILNPPSAKVQTIRENTNLPFLSHNAPPAIITTQNIAGDNTVVDTNVSSVQIGVNNDELSQVYWAGRGYRTLPVN
tara:strand:- start:37 stop:2022 length:1986 start_codon:yes stop_codon:yes gene_type:complete